MAEALVTVDALSVRLGRDLYGEEIERAQAIVDDVSAIALGETAADWTIANVPSDVAAVILSAALRVFKNPDRYISQTIGSFSATVHHSEFSSGLFTKAEKDILERNSRRSGLGVFGVASMGRYRDETPTQVEYWETNIPGSPVPYVVKDL